VIFLFYYIQNKSFTFIKKTHAMLKNYLLAFTFLFSGFISAQTAITITSTDMPNPTDSIRISVTGSDGGADLSLTGADFIWNFSTLTPDNQRFEKFKPTSAFPSPYNFIFNSINTSYGISNYQDTGTYFGFHIDAAFDFFKENSSYYMQSGASYTVDGGPIPFLFEKADTLYEFPMDYLDSNSCDYKYGLQIPTLGYYGQKGHRDNVVDGWGTLTTPFGTFSTLRIKSTVAPIDTIYYDAFGFGANITRPLRTEYKWIAAGMKIPVLYIEESGGQITTVEYHDSLRTGVPQIGIAEKSSASCFSIYPNPASSDFNIQFELNTPTKIKISILNTLGQNYTEIADKTFGEGKQKVAVGLRELGLSPGIYFVRMQDKNGVSMQKFVLGK
jgi:hypothetical protein